MIAETIFKFLITDFPEDYVIPDIKTIKRILLFATGNEDEFYYSGDGFEEEFAQFLLYKDLDLNPYEMYKLLRALLKTDYATQLIDKYGVSRFNFKGINHDISKDPEGFFYLAMHTDLGLDKKQMLLLATQIASDDYYGRLSNLVSEYGKERFAKPKSLWDSPIDTETYKKLCSYLN